ncbi:MAG TPA: hypothetical protein ENJ09_08630 [Planctomycetes bacterium]|nr:hypothetical protein [Planctomycetota bacterium]
MAGDPNPSGQIQEFLRVLRRRRWQIALPALFVFVLGCAFTVVIPKKYVVSTRVEIKESRNPFDYESKNRNESTTAREIENVEQHIINYARIERIVGTELIDMWPEYKRADSTKRDEIIVAIMKSLTVERIEKNKEIGSTFIDITYKDVDGKRAEAFLKKLNTAWIDDVITRDLENLELERDVLESEFKAASKRFQEENAKWNEQARLLDVNPSLPPDATDRSGNSVNDFAFQQLTEYRHAREVNENELADARNALQSLEESYLREPETVAVPVEVAPGESYRAERRAIEAQLEKRQAYLSSIKSAHSDYLKTKAEIEELEDKLAELERLETEPVIVTKYEENPVRVELRTQLDAARRRVDELAKAGKRLAAKVAEFEGRAQQRSEELALLAGFWDSKEEELKRRNELAAELRAKEKAIRLFRDTSGRVAEVERPPVASDKDREPNPWLLTAFFLFAGLALGLGVALAAEYARNCYRTVGDLALVMAVPVLGAVGTITTRRERRRSALRRAVIGISSAVILLGVAWIAFLYADESRWEKLPVPVLRAIEDFRLTLM